MTLPCVQDLILGNYWIEVYGKVKISNTTTGGCFVSFVLLLAAIAADCKLCFALPRAVWYLLCPIVPYVLQSQYDNFRAVFHVKPSRLVSASHISYLVVMHPTRHYASRTILHRVLAHITSRM